MIRYDEHIDSKSVMEIDGILHKTVELHISFPIVDMKEFIKILEWKNDKRKVELNYAYAGRDRNPPFGFNGMTGFKIMSKDEIKRYKENEAKKKKDEINKKERKKQNQVRRLKQEAKRLGFDIRKL